jgi:hypothetical protein
MGPRRGETGQRYERYSIFPSGTAVCGILALGLAEFDSGTSGMVFLLAVLRYAVFWALGVVKQGSGTSGIPFFLAVLRYAVFWPWALQNWTAVPAVWYSY